MKKFMSIVHLSLLLLLFADLEAQEKSVCLDYYFNHEFTKDKDGSLKRFHYTWEDKSQNGYSKWGEIFKANGFRLDSMSQPPSEALLRNSSVYLIVDPDTKNETANPHFITKKDIRSISNWVKKGGILLVMANDSGNAELSHLNELCSAFGIHLNADSKSKVTGNQYEMGAFHIPANDPVFKTAKKVYLKEVSSLRLTGKAVAMLKNEREGYVVAAYAPYGKGMAIVIGDPWFYNEYLNGRLGENNGWDNDKAAADLTRWISSKIPR